VTPTPQSWPKKHTALRTRRERSGLTREQLAVKAGLASSTLYLIERTGAISEENAAKLAAVLGCSAEDLFKKVTVLTVRDATEPAKKVGFRFRGADEGKRIAVGAGVLSQIDGAERHDEALGQLVAIVLAGKKAVRTDIAENIQAIHLGGGKSAFANKRYVVVQLDSAIVILTAPEWELNQAASTKEIEIELLELKPASGYAS
jgi:transcriptional regulator with XRE-family HTH domain